MSTVAPSSTTLIPPSLEGRAVLAKFFRAVGDPTRLALLQFIAESERSGTDCVEYAGLAQSRVSSHLACLVTCGLVALRREGRFAYYSVIDGRVLDLLRTGTEIAGDHAEAVAACTRTGQL